MIVTFPNFGYAGLAASKFFAEVGIEYVIPEKNSKSILKRGSEYAPEDMCMPFKYMMGNLMEAHDRGADTVIMMATAGPCRLGEYGQLLKVILDENRYKMQWILVDAPSVIGKKEFVNRIKKVMNSSEKNCIKIVMALMKALIMVRKMDGFRHKVAWKAGYLKEPHTAAQLLRETEKSVYDAESIKSCMNIITDATEKLQRLERRKNADPVKVLVTGEIYTSMEDDANGNIEEKLMSMGCCVKLHVNLTWWIRHTLLNSLAIQDAAAAVQGKKGMKYNVGGYSREAVNEIIRSHKFDGVIKVMPSGCMPEIVAKSYCENLQREKGIKILHLVYDEMSENTGYETRIEAFADMLERRKHVLAGDRYRLNKHRSGVDR